MPTEPTVEHCPNCGAPLELVAGACRWCGVPVKLAADAPETRDDDEDDDLELGDGEIRLPPAGWIVSTLHWVTYDAIIRAFLDANPEHLAATRTLVEATKAAAERLHAAGIEVEQLMPAGFDKMYTLDELWIFDLGADLLVWWTIFDGVDKDMRKSVAFELSRDYWHGPFGKRLKKVVGPDALHALRAAAPRRPEA
jgi:hypothetical protein